MATRSFGNTTQMGRGGSGMGASGASAMKARQLVHSPLSLQISPRPAPYILFFSSVHWLTGELLLAGFTDAAERAARAVVGEPGGHAQPDDHDGGAGGGYEGSWELACCYVSGLHAPSFFHHLGSIPPFPSFVYPLCPIYSRIPVGLSLVFDCGLEKERD